ncbi:hypothetical protein [Proteiniborus sp.]|uniref:hypothetical protein n=1 Tax=Proteiniborus sp. TaxID=2079015 RepID=UPI003329A560
MGNKNERRNSTDINGYEFILENQTNATFFPWSMIRDVDAIDTMRFYKDTDAVANNDLKENQLK